MNAKPAGPHGPLLVTEQAALVHWLAAGPNGSPWDRGATPPTLADWLALGDDATEAHYRRAADLGVPLVRLAALEPAHEATSLIRPDVARHLRVVPLLVKGDSIAVAMEDPGNHDALSTLDFLCRQRVQAMLATPRDIREAIARHYDQVEDRDVAHQLGLDPQEIDRALDQALARKGDVTS